MLALPLVLLLTGTGQSTADAAQAEQRRAAEHRALRDADAKRQAELMTRLVRRGDAAAVDYVVRAVQSGLPPIALHAFLVEAQHHPDKRYGASLQRLTHYRNPGIRARALVAVAALGPAKAHWAALRALDDPELDIRLLGLDLCRAHTTPDLEEAALRLIARDRAVAAAIARARRSQETNDS
jgi:hypothetical protein